MEPDPLFANLEQQTLQETLFGLRDPDSVGVDFLPVIWDAAESIASTDLATRKRGLERLEELGSARFSPLIAYLLVTRITEPDLTLRAHLVKMVASMLSTEDEAKLASEPVRRHLTAHLTQMRTRQIFALLQVADFDASVEPDVTDLLKACSFAGNHLAEILVDRQTPLPLRKRAALFISKVGFVDAVPALERVASRLEARSNKQRSMPGNASDENGEMSLLPLVKNALVALQAP